MSASRRRELAAVLCLLVLIGASSAYAFGGKSHSKDEEGEAPPRAGKIVIALDPVSNVRIEMPDQQTHDFGKDLEASLVTRFTDSGKFVVVDPIGPKTMARIQSLGDQPDYQWSGTYSPAATIRIGVDALSFESGSRGEHTFYGFDDRMKTPFNDGTLQQKNEFPLKIITFDPNWFDRTFDIQGTAPFDSASGLDLGDGFSINVLFAWLTMKYASYRSGLRLDVEVANSSTGETERRVVDVKGKGYFYDLAGAYMGYSGGIRLARKDAMDQALKRAIEASYDAIERSMGDLPLTARIDNVLPDGTILLGTGPGAGVLAGTRYELNDKPGTLIEVTGSVYEGSYAKIAVGDIASVFPGSIVTEARPGAPLPSSLRPQPEPASVTRGLASVMSSAEAANVIAAVDNVTLPDTNFPKPDLGPVGPSDNIAQAWLDSFLGTIFLPYRIYRYYQYDQAYKASSDSDSSIQAGRVEYNLEFFTLDQSPDRSKGSLFSEWSSRAASSSWGKQIGLDHAPKIGARPLQATAEQRLSGGSPVVAVIDSGVDYNHPVIHSSLWLNPNPTTDWRGKIDRYGWDFVSNDSRPYDDGYHGTQVASAVLAVAPHALIMPLKVFNPWGITNSAGMLAAFQYAVDHGANIIVCAWATRRYSKAIEQGVAYARSRGVLVVAAAGDRGDDLSQIGAYPAALSRRYENVLSVTGVDTDDEIVQVSSRFANYDPSSVQIAAPGKSIAVAEPRHGDSKETSTGLSAAIVAGAAARHFTDLGRRDGSAPQYDGLISRIRGQAKAVPGLEKYVSGGLRLQF